MVSTIPHLIGTGEPLQEFTWRVNVKSRRKNIPDFIGLRVYGIASEKAKAVIEALEPSVHEFFEIGMTLQSGEPTPKQYYIMNICQLVEAVDCKASQMELTQSQYGGEYYSLNTTTEFNTINMIVDVIVDLAKVEGKHLWRDRWNRGCIFVSNEFREAMERAGVSDLDYRPRVIAKPLNTTQV